MTDRFTIGLIQMAMSEDPDDNLERAARWVERSAREGAQVICLPELFRTRYFCQVEDERAFELAEPASGPSTERLGRVARQWRVTVLAPIFERRAPGLYHNSLAVIAPDGNVAGLYRKMHIPDDPGFCEKYYFTPGDLGFRTFQTPVGRVGTLICWDQWYPEAARLTALQGAAVLFYPTAIGWLPSEKAALGEAQLDAWRTVQRAHAIANGVYVAAVNRVGFEPAPSGDTTGDGIEFWGHSFLCDPFGQVLGEMPAGQEQTLLAEIDPKRIEEVRRAWPFLRDRRTDAYGDIARRYLDQEPPAGEDAS
jgi:N-carbamoylputrescine amidase